MRVKRKAFRLVAAFALLPVLASATTFQVTGTDAAPWKRIFGSIGITPASRDAARIEVFSGAAHVDAAALAENHILVIEGAGVAAQELGITAKSERLRAADLRYTCTEDADHLGTGSERFEGRSAKWISSFRN